MFDECSRWSSLRGVFVFGDCDNQHNKKKTKLQEAENENGRDFFEVLCLKKVLKSS